MRRPVGRQRSSDKTACCLREGSWLIVALTRSNDETSEQARTGQRREDGPGYSQSHAAICIVLERNDGEELLVRA
jgi:hypothetical protein